MKVTLRDDAAATMRGYLVVQRQRYTFIPTRGGKQLIVFL